MFILSAGTQFEGNKVYPFHFCFNFQFGSTMKEKKLLFRSKFFPLTLLHSDRPKLYAVHTILAFLSAIGLRVGLVLEHFPIQGNRKEVKKAVNFCTFSRNTFAAYVNIYLFYFRAPPWTDDQNV